MHGASESKMKYMTNVIRIKYDMNMMQTTFIALTLLFGWQEQYPGCRNLSVGCA